MVRFYSRLNRIEERKNIQKAVIYIILTISLIVFLVTFGLPLIARFAGFLNNLKSSTSPVEQTDITPPAPPQIENPPEFTNRDKLEIRGTTESGATIIISANGTQQEIIANRDGVFTYNFSLKRGVNTFSAVAKDTSGNESRPSKQFTITFDDEAPKVELSTPKDGQSFYGSSQRQILIEGISSDANNLTINGRVVVIESDGKFTYAVSLQEGDNNFEIVAEDRAGNKTTEKLTVAYWK